MIFGNFASIKIYLDNLSDKEYIMNKEFWKAALIRAIRTIAQTAIATIGTAAVLSEINWITVGSASIVAGILSILTSIVTGLPEV